MSGHVTFLPSIHGALQSVRESMTSSEQQQLMSRLSREITDVILAVEQAKHVISDVVFVHSD